MIAKNPRVLLYDVELFPNISMTWGAYDQNVIMFSRERMVCSVAWKWLGEKEIRCLALPHFYGYQSDYPENKKLIRAFYKEYCKADLTVAHNGKKFDEKQLNTDFLLAGLKPPPPHYHYDTLSMARRVFRFNSNRLDEIARILDVERKVQHEGFEMWRKAMIGDKNAWSKMILYNCGDIRTLEACYLALRSWDEKHPDLSNVRRDWACPQCGEHEARFKGYRYLLASVKKRWQCKSCGHHYIGAVCQDKKVALRNQTKGGML